VVARGYFRLMAYRAGSNWSAVRIFVASSAVIG
jgi:hypothetical protein